ncbi:MAG: hydroxyisourate hydrolase [Pseudomonadota bacterium]
MPGYLTTHVLDTAQGRPASGLPITLHRLEVAERRRLAEVVTNADGRTEVPILAADAFAPGLYELTFHAGDYLRAQGLSDAFLDTVPVRFAMTKAAHYHVPLLLSPFGYSTYRGS